MSNEAQMYTPGFVSNLQLAPQQKNTRLVQGVMADLSYTKEGKMFNADDVASDDEGEIEVTTRVPHSPEGGSDYVRRVGFFKSYQKGKFIENLEAVRMLQDPTNPVMASMMAAKARATDDRIIAAFFEPARQGETGENTVNFPSANVIDVANRDFLHDAENVPGSGNLPLTIGKLIKSKVMLDQSELEGERYFACGSVQLGNLLSSTPVTSQDYSQVKALVNGETNTLMGFNFIRTERLPLASNVRSCVAWIKDAMAYKERPIITARITQREDRSYRWYAFYEVERGACRRYDAGVLQVNCAENVF